MASKSTALSLWRITDSLAAVDAALEENGGELTPEIQEKLDAMTEALPAKVCNVAGYVRYLESLEASCKAEEERVREIRKASEKRRERVRRYLADCMERSGTKSVKPNPNTGLLSVSLLAGRTKVTVDDAARLPNDMVDIVFVRKPKTDDLKALLDMGVDVPGARLETGLPYVMIK
jgi:hypothetical protein